MRTTTSIGIAGALVLAGVGFVRPGEADDARALIAKSIQAKGGEANLAKLKSITWKEKGTYYGMGEGLPYTATYAAQWPLKFRMEVEGIFTSVFDGDKGWIQSGGDTKDMTKEQVASQLSDHRAGWISTLLPLKDKEFTLKSLQDAKVGMQMARVIQVTRKDYPEVKLYFDKKSDMLIKSEFRTKSPEEGFKEVTQEVLYSDYRDVDGGKSPHKILLLRDGKKFVEAELSDVKTVTNLDPKLFAKPAN